MIENKHLPYAFCKKFGVINYHSLQQNTDQLMVRLGTPVSAITEAQRVTGIVTELVMVEDQEFNRSLSQQFEKNTDG
ncbi:MAG: hypothetical protein KAU21_18870, partial [Gammaproteobacteria bacterium]|nr:hypothetical protein [Gammaproteobacteria bacterium]